MIEFPFSGVEWYGIVRMSLTDFVAACGDEPGPRRVLLALSMEGGPPLGTSGIWNGEIESDEGGSFVEITIPAMLGSPQWIHQDD